MSNRVGTRRYRPGMDNMNSAQWATSAANKFRQVARDTDNPNTKLLAEGLTHLAEAIRALATI